MSAKSVKLLFTALCVATLTALIYFAQSAATQSAPAYSTWNTGPDGAKLLFDGLAQSGLVQVSRQFKPITVQKPQQATVFFLGVDAYTLDGEDTEYFDSMEAAANRSNNLVIAIPDESSYNFKAGEEKTELNKRWGVHFVSEKGMFSTAPIVDKTWSKIGDNVWRRSFGNGAITLVGKGERLRNENIGMDDRAFYELHNDTMSLADPRNRRKHVAANRTLLYSLITQRPNVIFEEAHLGIQESGSIVGLARHYHLQGLMAGFIILAAMFVWSRSVSFPPPPPPQDKPITGSDTRAMLTELMSRHLKNQLITTCIAEWNRTRGHAAALTSAAGTNAVSAYLEIQQALTEKSKFKI